VGAKPTDNGVYTCRARNLAAAQVESADAFVLNIQGLILIDILFILVWYKQILTFGLQSFHKEVNFSSNSF